MSAEVKFQCPCCGCLTLDEPKGWEICPVCFWEDEGGIYDGDIPREDIPSVPNHMTLAQGRENFLRCGACEERMIPNVRKPAESEITDTYRALIDPPPGSYVIKTCRGAENKPAEQLSDEEIRCMIGQKRRLKTLLPKAVGIVCGDSLNETVYFPGDLLLALLRLDIADWKDNPDELERFTKLLCENREKIESCAEITVGLTDKYYKIL